MKLLFRLDQWLARIEGWFVNLFLGLMIFLTFLQVCLRGLYTHGHFHWANWAMGVMDWSEPFVRLLVLWLTFLGASLLTRENKHIRIDLFSALIPDRWLPYREVILAVACMVVSGLMVKVSIDYVSLEKEFGGNLFLQVPAWAGQIILPVGFGFLLFRFTLRALDQGLRAMRWGDS